MSKIDPVLASQLVDVAEKLISAGLRLGSKMKEDAQKAKLISPDEWATMKAQNEISLDEAVIAAGGTPPPQNPTVPPVEPQPAPTPTPTPAPPVEPQPAPAPTPDAQRGAYEVWLSYDPSDADYQNGDNVYTNNNGQWIVIERKYSPVGAPGWKLVRTIQK